MRFVNRICCFLIVLHFFGCSNTSQFDIEFEKTKSQLDSTSALLLERHKVYNYNNLHSACLFKTIKTNCNIHQEGLLNIAIGLGSITNDSIEASFGLPFGNYVLSLNSVGDSTAIEFKEFYKQNEQLLKFKSSDEFSHSLIIPLEYQIIKYENKMLEENIYEIWGKIETKKFIKRDLYKQEEIKSDCYWEIEFLSRIKLNKY